MGVLCLTSVPTLVSAQPAKDQPAKDKLQTKQSGHTAGVEPAAARKTAASGDLSQKSDSELTQLTAQWSHLSPSERRNLLAEVRGRMAASRQARRPIEVRVQRRYGRIVQKPDGSVVLQTRVVEMRPKGAPSNRSAAAQTGPSKPNAQAATTPRRHVTFGFGFERRIKSRNQPHTSEATGQGKETLPADHAP